MNINDRPYLLSYINNEGDLTVFVIDPDVSDANMIQTYNQFINGLFTGNRWTITEVLHLMNNGFKWTKI